MSGRRNTSSPEAPHGFRRGLVLFRRIFGRGATAAAALVVATLFGATAASAYWPAIGTGSTTAAVATLAPPTNVAVPATSNSNVAVAWTASAGTPAPTGYYVTRVTGATSMLACGSSPAAPITGTGCTDSSVPEGTHHYVVTAVHRSWTAVSLASGNVTVDNMNTINFIVQPGATVVAGSPLQPVTVELRTAFGIKLLASGVQVTIGIGNNPGGGTLSGTLTATTNIWGEATFTGLSINKAGTGYTLIASRAGYSGAVSTPFAVTAAAATQLGVTGPASGTASSAATVGPFTVERQDAYGNPVTATTSTDVTLGSTSTGTKLFAAASGGAAVTAVTIPANSASASFFYGDTKAGAHTLTASRTGLTAGATTVMVSAAAASKLVLGPAQIAPLKNTIINPPVTVSIQDFFGNLTNSTATVTVSSLCNLRGTLSVSAVAGVATFSTLSFNGNGANCTLDAGSTGLPTVSSNTFSYG
ncbi:hypothetical protein [Arthrobacter oryzae]|uniref:hypothetical protein n=1 Tax=Arthrobacter oryzae TaxID=409290 RepID=UPI00285977E3|nr:hypothetical protein [Arthrobacter oryzae]MDR6505127.1 hypothetical protein [Arthrobacter oryzae]